MIRNTIFALIAAVATLTIYLFIYLGLYKSADVRQESLGPLHLLYKNHLGAYHQVGATIHQVELWAGAHAVGCARTFGEYLDDPGAMDEDRLRARVGCVVDGKPTAGLGGEVEYLEYPAANYVVGRFTGSPAVGPWKVYPKIKQFIEAQRLKASAAPIEIYTIHGDAVDTEYLFRLDASRP